MGNLLVAVLIGLIGIPVLLAIARLAQKLDSSMGPAGWGIVGLFGMLWVAILVFLLIS